MCASNVGCCFFFSLSFSLSIYLYDAQLKELYFLLSLIMSIGISTKLRTQ